MPQSLSNILVHIIFSTKNRYPFLSDKDIRSEMHVYHGGTCNNLDCQVIVVGGISDQFIFYQNFQRIYRRQN